MRRTIPLDGPNWMAKGYLGLDGALAAARHGFEGGPGWLPATVPGSASSRGQAGPNSLSRLAYRGTPSSARRAASGRPTETRSAPKQSTALTSSARRTAERHGEDRD